jgi:uncharacterized protein GlcG (DUF336 family)
VSNNNISEGNKLMTARALVTALCAAGLMASAATPSLAAPARKAAPAPAAKTTPKIEWVKSIPLDLAIAAVEVAIADCRKNGKRGSFGVMDMDGQWKVRILDDYTGEVGQHALDHKMYTSVLTQETTYPMIVQAETQEKTRGEIGRQADILDKIAPGGLVSPGGYALKVDGQFVGVLGAGGTAQGYGPGSEAKCAEAGGKWFESQVNSK